MYILPHLCVVTSVVVVHSNVAASQNGSGSFVAGGWKSDKSRSLPGGGPVGGAGGGTGVGA